jgi:molybdenum cofactor biosynthesis protein B
VPGSTQPSGSASTTEHRREARSLESISCDVIVVSDSRTARTDVSGRVARKLVEAAGYGIGRSGLVANEPDEVGATIDRFIAGDAACLLLLGGTGLSSRDRTVETVRDRLDKELPGYGEAFRRLSWDEIGTAAILSRALAGSIGDRIVVVTPGSPNAVETALSGVLLPELAHLVREVRR